MNSMQSCDSGTHLMQFDNAPINLLVLPICLCLCFCLCIWSPAEAGDSVLVYNVSLYSYLINQSWSLSSFLALNFQFVEASMAQGIIVSAPADCNWEEISNNTLRTHQDNNDDEKERIVSEYDYSPILYFISPFSLLLCQTQGIIHLKKPLDFFACSPHSLSTWKGRG